MRCAAVFSQFSIRIRNAFIIERGTAQKCDSFFVYRSYSIFSHVIAKICALLREHPFREACSLYMYEAVLCIFGRITIMQASRLTSLVHRIITGAFITRCSSLLYTHTIILSTLLFSQSHTPRLTIFVPIQVRGQNSRPL